MEQLSKFKSNPVIIGALSVLVISSGTAFYVFNQSWRQPVLEVYVIPLKSGQALFIRTPNDKRILVDGGKNSEIIRSISSILPFYSRRIDILMVTKPDSSHVTGLIDVLNRFEVNKVIVPKVNLEKLGLASSSDQIYQTFLETVGRKKVPLKEVLAGDQLNIDKTATSSIDISIHFPVQIEVSNNHKTTGSFKYSKASGPELVFDISYGSTTIMSIGSVTPKIQKYLAQGNLTINNSNQNVLITAKNPISSNLAPVLIEQLRPKYLIYSKAIPKSVTDQDQLIQETSWATMSTTTKKKQIDPIATIPDADRFNIREKGTVRIISDGVAIRIITR